MLEWIGKVAEETWPFGQVVMAGLVAAEQRGIWWFTERGRRILKGVAVGLAALLGRKSREAGRGAAWALRNWVRVMEGKGLEVLVEEEKE